MEPISKKHWPPQIDGRSIRLPEDTPTAILASVFLNPMHKGAELVHEFDDSGARALVTTGEAYAAVASIRARTMLETVVLTACRDFLPEQPSLPPPPSLRDQAAKGKG